MMHVFAARALLPDGWRENVAIDIDEAGIIARVDPGAGRAPHQTLLGIVIPGMPNLHSHTFQRAMAGAAERRLDDGDDFWSWRTRMYGLVDALTPDTLYEQALATYAMMLSAGYTSVAEFQYVHRDPAGEWYADRAAMARALIRAAREVGLAICLLPALYAHGGAGAGPLAEQQRRFASSVDDILTIAAELRSAFSTDDGVVIGRCAHSLRAVTPEELRDLIDGSPRDVPMHIHVAEQRAEVEEVCSHLGASPVRWLIENMPVDKRWCLVHATQADDAELDAVGSSGAIIGLCPTTEANLGDGIFPSPAYFTRGSYGIGSDSNVTISPAQELRLLEYSQRLALRRRAVISTRGRSCGDTLYADTALGGAHACGLRAGLIAAGRRADLVVLAEGDQSAPLDQLIFAETCPMPQHVMTSGAWRVWNGALAI